ncbi:MAG: glycosyltransferase [Bacteroides ovatus]|nr:glycosyltransferase [Bacteroides ovatus]
MEVQKITVFTEGNASSLKTWSNVPYFFTQTLIEQGYNVNKVDISAWNLVRKIYNHSINKILSTLFPTQAYQFERTGLYNYLVERKIERYIKSDNSSDLYIFMTFTFYNKWNSVPSVIFSDWSYDYYIKDRCKRKPYFFEKKYLKKQIESFQNAMLTISLFKGCADYIKKQVPEANVQFLGGNVINSLFQGIMDDERWILNKRNKIRLLFIGMKKYKEGADLLIQSFSILKNKYPDAELHIIGMNKGDFQNIPDSVYCYGYLRKDDPAECRRYYELLISATLFVNPTKEWAGYSSTIEAMYFYTPVVISPYQEFVREFGEKISFGCYNQTFSKECLCSNMEKILTTDKLLYGSMCLAANNMVRYYTWDEYMKRLMNLLK